MSLTKNLDNVAYFFSFLTAAKNSVEVYLRNGGTKSRCSQYFGKLQNTEGNLSLHQLQNGTEESQTSGSQKFEMGRAHVPNLRR